MAMQCVFIFVYIHICDMCVVNVVGVPCVWRQWWWWPALPLFYNSSRITTTTTTHNTTLYTCYICVYMCMFVQKVSICRYVYYKTLKLRYIALCCVMLRFIALYVCVLLWLRVLDAGWRRDCCRLPFAFWPNMGGRKQTWYTIYLHLQVGYLFFLIFTVNSLASLRFALDFLYGFLCELHTSLKLSPIADCRYCRSLRL